MSLWCSGTGMSRLSATRKRQVTNRDFNFVQDWNAGSSDGRSTDNHDTFSAKVTPRAQYIISSSKPSPAHGNHHIPELSDLISSSPIPVVIQSPPARAIPSKQASIGEDDDDEEELADEEDEEEEMAEEEESGRDGDASMVDSTMAVKDDGESESDSFVVEATIQHAQEEDVNGTLYRSRKETTQRIRYSTSDREVSGGVYSEHSETGTIDSRADESEREKDGRQKAVHHDEELEEEEEEQVDRHEKLNISSMHVEKEKNNDLSSRTRRSSAKDNKEEEEGIEDTRLKKLDRKSSSLEEKSLNNRSSRKLRARSRGNDPEDNMNVQTSSGVLHSAGLPNESEQRNRVIEADSDDCTDRSSSQNQRNDRNQRNRSKIQTNRSGGHHIETVFHNETRESDDGDENEKPLHKNRPSLNNRENVRNSVSKSPKQAKNLNKSRSADKEQQNQTFERRKTRSGKKERLTRHSSMEQNDSDKDVSETHDSDLEEEETAGKRRGSLSESRTKVPQEGDTDEEEIMEEIGDEDMEEDVTQDQMLRDEISQEETAASIMIQSTIQDTPITTKSHKKLKRSLVNKINNDNEKEDNDDINVGSPAKPVPPPLKQKKISFSSGTKKSDEKKRKEPGKR
ncbi:hypothetical protein KP79_PYT00803 [Mizuhopecten yessoensis]|uniref:Uncharacterized protein n=1 Tax=Mizuhopecten yessoensis TaxID=6573 RepID=A0A210QQ77_MIZYE|nr:hypothetical protein KP79_PYT00803 [Mizuhopecten yessoensis]